MPRRPSKKRIGEYVITALLVLVILWLLWMIWGIARKEERARSAVADTRAELALLEERKAVLEGNLAELATERGKEATLRQTYGVAKPGEEVIIVVPPKEEPLAPHIPWWKRAFNWAGFW
jgi:cell division protein FtsB